MTKWYESQAVDSGVIVSSRIRLARNLAKYPFPAVLASRPGMAAKVSDELVSAVINDRTPISIDFNLITLDGSRAVFESRLLEKHSVSAEFIKKEGIKSLLLNNTESVSIMINEEDHARIQTIFPGDNLDEGYFLANKMDDLIEESLEYAFDSNYGYLTSCPTNTGTGLRASYMLNLSALEMTGQINTVLGAINKFGMTVRGIYGEGSVSLGSMYQISNQMTLGKTENEIISALKSVTAKIIEQENGLSSKLLSDKNGALEDRINRAYGILKHAKRLNLKETMNYLSDVRIGLISGVLDVKRPQKTIYGIMMDAQNGGVREWAGRPLDDNEIDVVRAEMMRAVL